MIYIHSKDAQRFHEWRHESTANLKPHSDEDICGHNNFFPRKNEVILGEYSSKNWEIRIWNGRSFEINLNREIYSAILWLGGEIFFSSI